MQVWHIIIYNMLSAPDIFKSDYNKVKIDTMRADSPGSLEHRSKK